MERARELIKPYLEKEGVIGIYVVGSATRPYRDALADYVDAGGKVVTRSGRRRAAAGQCEESLQYGIRTFVDDMDDRVNKLYAAYPTRLYLVDEEGCVSYAGGLGPWGFKPPDFQIAIENHLENKPLTAGT